MTPVATRRRWPRRAIRALAWTSAGSAFLTVLGVLGGAPVPQAANAHPTATIGRKVIVRRVIKRVVIVTPTKAPVRYVTVTAAPSTATGGGTAPAPVPTTTSGGSHP